MFYDKEIGYLANYHFSLSHTRYVKVIQDKLLLQIPDNMSDSICWPILTEHRPLGKLWATIISQYVEMR